MASPGAPLVDVKYLGGPGYFLILNSMVFRLPRPLKKALSRPLSVVDAGYNMLPGTPLFPYFLARWRRV
jgi:hypothetical protein